MDFGLHRGQQRGSPKDDGYYQDAEISTLVWLGAIREPTELVEFCDVILLNRVIGEPLIKTELAPCVCRDDPMTVPEATPILTPALSPFVIGVIVARLWTGEPTNKMLGTFGVAVFP
jgi:hypothetical protein